MTRTLIVTLALTVLATPILAEGKRADVEKKLFEGYFLEHGKRDLEKAKSAYEEVAWECEEEFPDLSARAYIGLFRLAIRRGDPDAEQFVKGVEAALELAAKGSKPEVLAALNREFEAAKAMLVAAKGKDVIDTRIARFVEILDQGPDSNNGKHAVADLVLFGDRAVPAVAVKLRSDHPRAVAAAARVLVRIQSEPATAALSTGVADPKVMFPAQIVSEMAKGTPRLADALARAMEGDRVDVQRAAANALLLQFQRHGSKPKELWEAMFRGLEAKDAARRNALLALSSSYWTPEATVRLVRLLGGDADPRTSARVEQIVAHGLSYEPGMTDEDLEILPRLMDLSSWQARRRVLTSAISAGGELAVRVMVRALDDPSVTLRDDARQEIQYRNVPWSERYIPALCDSLRRIVMTEATNSWPRSASEVQRLLLQAKKTDENGNRLVAVLKSVLDEGPEDRRGVAAGYVYRLLQDYSAEVKLAAYGVLTRDKDRAAWFLSLAPTAGKPVVDLAGKALASRDANLRSAAIRALGTVGDDRVLVTKLKPLVSDQDVKIRRAAVVALMPRVSVEFRRDLALKAITDKDLKIRLVAVNALIETPKTAWYEPLLEAVAKDPNGIAVAAVRAVAARGDHDATRRFLAQVLEKAKDATDNIRAAAFQAAGDALTDRMIIDALRSGEQGMVGVACRLAAERHLLDAWPVMLDIKSKYPFVKSYLQNIRDYHVGMKEYLDVRDTKSEDLYAKAAALAASTEEQQRVAACYAFAALKGPKAMSRLLDLVTDESITVRMAALEALKKLSLE